MYHVVTIRVEDDKYAHGHICDNPQMCLCGLEIPQAVREAAPEWDDPRNPYLDRANVSCQTCLSVWKG